MNYLTMLSKFLGFSGGPVVKNLFASAGVVGSIPGLGRSLEKKMATYSSILTGKAHGQRRLACYSPWDYQESDTT